MISFGGLQGLSDGRFVVHDISMMVGFVQLRDLNDSWFCCFMRFQRWSVLVGYKVSVMVDFVRLRDLNDGWFCCFMRFQ